MTDYNAAERNHVRIANRDARLASRQQHEFIANLMSTPMGRAWMHDILTRCHVFANSFTGDALTSAFAEGERNIGLQHLNDIMQACPDQYVTMMREANARSSAGDSRRRQATASDPDRRNQGPVSLVEPDAAGDGDETTGNEDFGYATPGL